MAWFFMLASGQNMCSKNESNANNNDNKYCTNVTDLIQQLTAQIIRLETKIDTLSAVVNKSENLPLDCEDVRKQRQEATIESGLYLVQVPGLLKRRIYCNFTEQETWTTISRRIYEEDIFNRSWAEYKSGFGKANGDYWIGNEMLYRLTNNFNYSLRVSMTGFRGKFVSSYKSFKIGNEISLYRLQLGDYDSANSNGGDSFFPMVSCNKKGYKNASFSTYDVGISKNCSKTLSGGWWFTDCGCSNLNGKYVLGGSVPTKGPNIGLYWDSIYYGLWGMKSSLRSAVMEIKRL